MPGANLISPLELTAHAAHDPMSRLSNRMCGERPGDSDQQLPSGVHRVDAIRREQMHVTALHAVGNRSDFQCVSRQPRNLIGNEGIERALIPRLHHRVIFDATGHDIAATANRGIGENQLRDDFVPRTLRNFRAPAHLVLDARLALLRGAVARIDCRSFRRGLVPISVDCGFSAASTRRSSSSASSRVIAMVTFHFLTFE